MPITIAVAGPDRSGSAPGVPVASITICVVCLVDGWIASSSGASGGAGRSHPALTTRQIARAHDARAIRD